jgi:quercetin dioxygenase-like cupin family protein
MPRHRIIGLIVAFIAGGGFLACSEDAPVAPGGSHTGMSGDHMGGDVTTLALEPFTFRATLDPFSIHQLPDFMIHSQATKDIVIQRAVFAPGAGPWHTHPGPSFVYVIEGEIKIERFSKKDGCTESPVQVAGTAYFEVADQVHRAVVVSAEPAVLMVTRFNIPVGQPFTIMAADPGCAT